jgi:hypothetical protein
VVKHLPSKLKVLSLKPQNKKKKEGSWGKHGSSSHEKANIYAKLDDNFRSRYSRI